MKCVVGLLAAILIVSNSAAFANAAAGDACAVKLSIASFLIYAAAMARTPTNGNWQFIVETETKLLASAKRIAAGSARDSEAAAAGCVKMAVE